MDFIRSKTDRASKVAMNQIEGRLSDLIKRQRQSILEILAQVEVNIDYQNMMMLKMQQRNFTCAV